MRRTRIKMCGTTSGADGNAAVEAGIDALGFIFAPASPRAISPEQAAAIIATLPPFISRVGVFVNAAEEHIRAVVSGSGLTQVQLHGEETPEFCRSLKKWNRSLAVCKAFRVGRQSPAIDLSAYLSCIDSVLLDTYDPAAAGGTGRSFNWDLIAPLKCRLPLILAGGLSPANVQQAIEQVRPYAIDINSGVERAPGIKDLPKLRELVARVREIDSRLCSTA